MANLLSWGKRAFDQVNPFDSGRTFSQQTPLQNKAVISNLADIARGGKNIAVEGVIKPGIRTSMAYSQAFGNLGSKLAGVPTQNAQQFYGPLARPTGYTGTKQQVVGDLATNLFNFGIPAGGATIAKGIGGVLPKVVPKIIPRVIGGAVSGAVQGGPSQVANLMATGQPLDRQNIQQAFKQGTIAGAAFGGGLPIAGAAVRNAPKVARKAAQGLDTPEILQLKAQKQASVEQFNKSNATKTQLRNHAANVADLDRQIKAIQERGSVQLPGVSLKGRESVANVAKLPTTIPDGPNIPRRIFQSVRGDLSRNGEAGVVTANKLQTLRSNSEIGQQAFIDSIPTVAKLGKKDFPTFVDTLDALSRGEKPQMSPKIAQAVKEWSANIPKVQERAVASGKKVGNRGPYYFPREYDDLLKSKDGFNSAVNHLVRSGQVKSQAEAIQALRFAKSGRNYGHFKEREFDIPGYDKSPETLGKYVAGAFDDISKSEQFGPNGEVGAQLLAKMAEDGYDAGRAMKNLDIALGNVDKSTLGHKVSGNVRKFNALRSLSTAGVSNATQPINIATVSGIGRTLKGVAKEIASPAARKAARETGVMVDSALSNLSSQGLGVGGKITRNVASPFFRQVEKHNRQLSAIVGVDWGNSLAKKAAKGDVKSAEILRSKLGVTGEIGQKLTHNQEIQAARGLTEISQFKVDPQDLPGWVDSPLGKLAAQFRTFGYKQTSFMYNQVVKEAAKGNVAPLVRFVALAVPAGAAAQYVKSKIKGVKYTEEGESKASQGAKAIAAVGGFGLPGSEGQNIYKSNQYGNTPGAVVGTVGGPTASLITETADNIRTGQQGKGWQKLTKQGIRSIPAVGPSIANRVLPKKVYPKANPNGTPAEKDAAAKAEKESLKTNAGNGYSMQQTSDGKYAYTLDGDTTVHTAKSLSDARMEIAKAGFSNESGSYKVVGDKVLRKGADGKVTSITKTAFDYQIGTATLVQQKNAGDLQAWLGTADKQIASIQKQLQDPNIDPLEALKLQNDAQNLMDNAAKYQEYGGFTKPKAAKKFPTTSFKIANAKIAKPKGISVRKPAAFKAPSTRKLAVSKLPSSYLKRKLA